MHSETLPKMADTLKSQGAGLHGGRVTTHNLRLMKACSRFMRQIIAVAEAAHPLPLFASTPRNSSHRTETQQQDGFAVRAPSPACEG